MAETVKFRQDPWGRREWETNCGRSCRQRWLILGLGFLLAEESPLAGRKVVRGGSWYNRPHRARSGFRLSYPAWQGVYNVGFRVVSEERREEVAVANRSADAGHAKTE